MKEIEIPDSVNKVENYAFAGCKSLKTVSYPSGLDVSNASIPTVTTQAEYVKAEDGSVTITKIIPAENGTITLPEAIGGVKPAISQEAKDALKSVEHTHGGGKATCSAKAVCDFCDTGYGETKAHTEEVIPEKPATCTETGLTAGKRCSVCSTVITAPTTIPAKGHSLDSGTVTKEASCTEKGEKTYSCANCDYTKTEEIAALGHSFTQFVSNNDATCTTDGTKTAKCDNESCEETKTVADTGSAKGHSLDSGTVTKEASCTEKGEKTYSCANCDYTETEKIAALGHNFVDGKCTVCQAIDDGHTCTGGTATCKKKAVCTICGKEYGELAAHVNETISAVPATCTAAGSTAGVKCSVCDKVITAPAETAALGHSFTQFVSNNDATCTTDGTETATCDRCAETTTQTDVGSAKGHKYGSDWKFDSSSHWHECTVCGNKNAVSAHTEDSGTVTTPPTTEAAGVRTYACTECGSEIRTEVIPMLDPDHTHEYGTSWSSNKTEHWHECVCGETIDRAAHIWDGGTVTESATCTESGIMTCACTICGITKTEPVEALGHSFTNYIYNNDATCTEDGTETAVCDRCTETKTRTAVGSKTGHTASDWQNDSDSHWHECECGEKTDTAAHTEDYGTVTKQPTATETGIRAFSCTVCGYVMNTEIIPAAGTPSTSVTPPSVPSTATSAAAAQTPSKEPFIQGDNGKTGWEAISDTILGTPDGGTVTVNMNSTTKLPKKIVSQIKDRDIDLVLEMGGGFVWTINGMSVTKAKTVDMGVRKAIKIPKSTVQEFFGASKAVQLDLRHNGDFGFTAVLTVDIGNKYSGMYANSYCYKTRKFEFGDSAKIADGQARLKFTHASSWLITVEDSPVIEDVSSAAGIYEKSENSEDSKMPAVISGTSIIAALGIFYLKTRGKTR